MCRYLEIYPDKPSFRGVRPCVLPQARLFLDYTTFVLLRGNLGSAQMTSVLTNAPRQITDLSLSLGIDSTHQGISRPVFQTRLTTKPTTMATAPTR
jgi:hypothetical protein